MIVEGHWKKPGVWNMEQLDPDLFMEDMNKYGLPWHIVELNNFSLDQQ
jgi:saccharopine dehydrogenase (NAD+, L-lysine-forming)